MPAPVRRLAVNADDFGFSRDVNRGIIEAHTKGILTSTTLMANGAAFDHAVELAREHPALDIGVHFVLVGGVSLVDRRPLPLSVTELVRAVLSGAIPLYNELKAQVLRIVDAGLTPTHLDTHKHTHLLPPVLQAVARLAREFNVPWVRRPFDLPLTSPPADIPWTKRAVSRGLRIVRTRFHRTLAKHGCQTTDHFAGFQLTGRLGPNHILNFLRHLPPGTTEFMCHPGYCTEELLAARTRLKESREKELIALMDPRLPPALAESGVELRTFPRLLD